MRKVCTLFLLFLFLLQNSFVGNSSFVKADDAFQYQSQNLITEARSASYGSFVSPDLIVADFEDDDWDDDEWDEDWDDWEDEFEDEDDGGFYDDGGDSWSDKVSKQKTPAKTQPKATATASPAATKTTTTASTSPEKKEEYKQDINADKVDFEQIEAEIAAVNQSKEAAKRKNIGQLAKKFKRPPEDFIKMYSQYGDLLSGLDPNNPKDAREIEKLIEIVGVPKRERKERHKPTVKKAPTTDPLVNFSARNIPARDAFATLARVSGKSITVSGQINDRDLISVVEINNQPFTKAFLSLVEAADVDFSSGGDNYTILKRKARKSTSLTSSLNSTDIDLDLPLEERYADLIYDNEDLSSIIKDLANKYGVDVVMTATPTERITLRVRGVNIEDAFELVFSGSQFSYTRKSDTFVVYSASNKNFSLDSKTILFPLKYLEAAEAQKLLPSELKNLVQVSENQNAFIAEGSKAELTQLYEFIRTIDKPIPQVELNVKLVEVSKDFARANNLLADSFTVGRFGRDVGGGQRGGFDIQLDDENWNVFSERGSYSQNSQNSQTKVNQRVLVTSGKSAKINFDEDVNVILNAADPGQNTGVVQNQRIQRITAGNSMNITPVVGGGGVVTVKVDVEVSANGPINQSTGVPTNTTRRRLSSEIQITDHETIAIGGLFDDRKGNTNGNEAPLLSKLPVIGHFFTNNGSKTKNLKELIILITPHIRSGTEEEQIYIQAEGAF